MCVFVIYIPVLWLRRVASCRRVAELNQKRRLARDMGTGWSGGGGTVHVCYFVPLTIAEIWGGCRWTCHIVMCVFHIHVDFLWRFYPLYICVRRPKPSTCSRLNPFKQFYIFVLKHFHFFFLRFLVSFSHRYEIYELVFNRRSSFPQFPRDNRRQGFLLHHLYKLIPLSIDLIIYRSPFGNTDGEN